MFELENTIISTDVADEFFACDLSKCKGACCVEGDMGAPLEEEELGILDDEYDKFKKYLSEEGRAAIEKQGRYVLDEDGDFSTPLINGKECAYVVRDENSILKCGIEQAHLNNETEFKKPISCHLYPIRVAKLGNGLEALNYDRWPICNDARVCGKSIKLPVYKFLKEALIRKYGESWFSTFEKMISFSRKNKKSDSN